VAADDAPRPQPANAFFAFCMDTHDAKKRTLSQQATMLKELEYAGAGHLWLGGVGERLRTLDAAGLRLFQIYVRLNLSPSAKQPYDPRLREVLPLLKGRDVMLAVLVSGGKPSDPALMPRAVKLLREIGDLARPHGVRVAVYPHAGDWLERVEDAVRVAKQVDRREVGVMFNLCHWLRVGDERQLQPLLKMARPYLFAVSINGADRAADIQAGKGKMIYPLGRGAFDNYALLRELRKIDFRGPIGLQCYGLPGDARVHLAQSMKTWKLLSERLDRECPRPAATGKKRTEETKDR